MSTNTTEKALKSVKMTKEEFSAFSKWVKKQSTKVFASDKLGIERVTLDRLLDRKSGSPETIKKIKAVLAEDITAVTHKC